MNLNLILVLFSLITSKENKEAHKFYVSHSTIHYNEKEQAVQVSVKLFADDFLQALKEAGYENFAMEKNNKAFYGALEAYLPNHFNVSITGVPSEAVFVGWEPESDLIWLYMEYPDIKAMPGHIDLECKLLVSSFPEQQNIIHFEIGNQRKSALLNARETSVSMDF